MARYINGEQVVRELLSLTQTDGIYGRGLKRGIDLALAIVNRQDTADVVEVVRCKDCKKFVKKGEEFLQNDVYGFCKKSQTGFFDDGEEVYGNDFCNYGERKDSECS